MNCLILPEDEYHAADGFGSTTVKVAYDSPKALAEHLERPDFMKPKRAHFEFGSIFHRMVLEPERFEKEYVLTEKAFPNYGLKTAKDYLAGLEQETGKKAIKAEDAYELLKMHESVMAIPQVKKLLGDGLKTELSYFADKGDYIGKARFDIQNDNVEMFGDLKTIDELTQDKIQKAMLNYSYDIQMAHYLDVVNRDWPFVFIFAEKKPPYKACLVVPSDDFRSYGFKRLAVCKHNIKRYRQSCRSADFPEVMQIRQPEYAIIKTIGE